MICRLPASDLKPRTSGLLFLLLLCASTSAQRPVFTVAADLVLLNVSVKDSQGHPVVGLRQSDFAVLEEGRRRQITYFEEQNSPLAVVLLMDTSSSMEGKPLLEAKRAALAFVDQMPAHTEIALVGFNDRVSLLQPFSSMTSDLRAAIGRLTASGGTALYDAVKKGFEVMQEARHRRHIVVLFSDGQDQDSRASFAQIERLVQGSDSVIFSVGEYSEIDRDLFMTGEKYYKEPAFEVNLNPVWILRELADLTGGSAFFPQPGGSLQEIFGRIARELRLQYLLGYVPAPPSAQPEFRKVEVQVENPGSDYTVRTRRGYRYY
ncbi:MAG: VWA domain-containing protein [Acidobacteriota bacterium]